ncbi:putative alpha/beta hydrolase fold protein [Mycobacterium xenopi 3993]|nr:putative alpha/beta hydrolase fold protein [Mycobacterium xenopi 3993]
MLADHVERQLDELGWNTAHIVGNSLGGWVAFELESRAVRGRSPRSRRRRLDAMEPGKFW